MKALPLDDEQIRAIMQEYDCVLAELLADRQYLRAEASSSLEKILQSIGNEFPHVDIPEDILGRPLSLSGLRDAAWKYSKYNRGPSEFCILNHGHLVSQIYNILTRHGMKRITYAVVVSMLADAENETRGIRNPHIPGIAESSLVVLYTHLNSLGLCPFEDGYRPAELGQVKL